MSVCPWKVVVGSLVLGPILAAGAAARPQDEPAVEDAPKAEKPAGRDEKAKAEEPIVTHHELKLGERTLKYTATAGMLPIRDDQGKEEAQIFHVAYMLDDAGDPATRPLMFSFNGGPGSASVWLHLGALGPRRVATTEGPTIPAPPFKLVDNDQTWLDKTDLVFIDPVGTGYSRAARPELNRKFHGLRGDIDSVAEFIRLYLVRSGRWGSPIFLVGESYGTTRAAGLADALVERGIALNGIVLVSAVLNFQTTDSGPGNDLPYVLYLPTLAATAWYHEALGDDRPEDLPAYLDEVEAFAAGDYTDALLAGDRLGADARAAVVAKLSKYLGLSADYVDRSDLRVGPSAFRKELLRARRRTVGRLDSRYLGIDPAGSGEANSPGFDPSMAAIRPPYTSTFNDYARRVLKYETDVPYHILGEGVGPWDWGTATRGGFPDTGNALRDALAKNPAMRVMIASGYYDLATPYYATEHTVAHLGLDPELRRNLSFAEYPAGHMMYVDGPSLAKLKADVAGFLDAATGGP